MNVWVVLNPPIFKHCVASDNKKRGLGSEPYGKKSVLLRFRNHPLHIDFHLPNLFAFRTVPESRLLVPPELNALAFMGSIAG